MAVQLNFFNKLGYKFDREVVERRVGEVLAKQKITGDVEIDVSIVSEKEMRKLDRKWMKGPGELHDVLSFPLGKDKSYPDGVARLGDIVVCYPEALRLGESVEFLVEHGCLHLLGIHHE